jgi:hypothetical protein
VLLVATRDQTVAVAWGELAVTSVQSNPGCRKGGEGQELGQRILLGGCVGGCQRQCECQCESKCQYKCQYKRVGQSRRGASRSTRRSTVEWMGMS